MKKKGLTGELSGIIIAIISAICLIASTLLISANILGIVICNLPTFTINFLGLVLFFVGGLGTLLYVILCDKAGLFNK